jgi:galactofuranosylgalactofuranosylrhamnosyl-N-acetylglucosaminyl-diphospho-decaprenol beta-1,5/1,6-galactofuranosyltransferase
MYRGDRDYMHIVCRIKFPKSADVSGLYIQVDENTTINYNEDPQEIILRQGGSISSNSYFNSFYESFYAKYTDLSFIYYLLKLEGSFQVSVYRELYGQNDRQLVSVENFYNCQSSDFVKIQLPKLVQNETLGRIYFELMCLSTNGLFKEGLIVTDQNKSREVALGIISCTFKKEVHIKNTVNTILQDDLLQKKDFKIFVVDNGRTLNEDELKHPKFRLIPNRNIGGSGGFTRGLVEALEESNYSHFLFMDDDIELDSECIYRLFSLYEYAKLDFAVAGSMLDLYKKHVLHEAGALYSKAPKKPGFMPFAVTPLKHKINLQNSTFLNSLLLEEDIDYGGFWFFSFSKEILKEIGLLLPLFIKVDDIEFGLRIKNKFGTKKIVAFPSIAVWHEPFYAKFPIWDRYYQTRNGLITYAIYEGLGYVDAIKYTTERLISRLLLFDYNSAEMIIKAFEDYVKGPNFIKSSKPETLHSEVLNLSKKHTSQSIEYNYFLTNDQFCQGSRPVKVKKAIKLLPKLLTFIGQMLPNFLTTDDDVLMCLPSSYIGQRSKASAKKRVLVFVEGSGCLLQHEINKTAGIKLLIKWFQVAARSTIKWSFISTAWKNAANELISIKFWQQYMGIQESKVQRNKAESKVKAEA